MTAPPTIAGMSRDTSPADQSEFSTLVARFRSDITSLPAIESAIASKYTTLRHDTGFVALLNNGGPHVERSLS